MKSFLFQQKLSRLRKIIKNKEKTFFLHCLKLQNEENACKKNLGIKKKIKQA
jgi:hypothetical protein